MDEVRIVDTTLRDGDISLWAYGLTTGMMLPALALGRVSNVVR
jgi:pyruvate/oxaloacetate carboxyltransferase